MTAHGAYTKALAAARHTRGYAHDAAKNIQAFKAAYPLPEDPDLIRELDEIAEAFKALHERLGEIKDRTFRVAETYLKKHGDKVSKGYELNRGSPSTQLRRSKK